MNAQDIIRNTAGVSAMVLTKYVEDLSDADLMERPGPGCNHLAWQLGHLISSECSLLDSICPGKAIELPEGFAERHGKEAVGENDPSKFCTKAEYLNLLAKAQAATSAALDDLSEADLDAEAPEQFREFFPTVGAIFSIIATHPMMHAGQFVPVRRKLDKPVLM